MSNKPIMKYSTYKNLNDKKNYSQKTKYYQQKLLNKYAFSLNNSPKNNI